ncbi:MAG: hypothetical protein IIX68_04520 [Clostridia bacterium]|nr:hypothetical protein [Clostridia bacterium]
MGKSGTTLQRAGDQVVAVRHAVEDHLVVRGNLRFIGRKAAVFHQFGQIVDQIRVVDALFLGDRTGAAVVHEIVVGVGSVLKNLVKILAAVRNVGNGGFTVLIGADGGAKDLIRVVLAVLGRVGDGNRTGRLRSRKSGDA